MNTEHKLTCFRCKKIFTQKIGGLFHGRVMEFWTCPECMDFLYHEHKDKFFNEWDNEFKAIDSIVSSPPENSDLDPKTNQTLVSLYARAIHLKANIELRTAIAEAEQSIDAMQMPMVFPNEKDRKKCIVQSLLEYSKRLWQAKTLINVLVNQIQDSRRREERVRFQSRNVVKIPAS